MQFYYSLSPFANFPAIDFPEIPAQCQEYSVQVICQKLFTAGFTVLEKAIRNAFRELIDTYPFEKITVKMIFEKAEIAKPAFYLHYPDKYSPVDTLMNEFSDQLEHTFRNTLDLYLDSPDKSFLGIEKEGLEMILENMPVFMKLTVDGVPFIRKIKKAMISSCYSKYISIGYPDSETQIMAWQAASLTLDYCEFITENPLITMQDYWKSMNNIIATTRNIYEQ